MDGDTQGWLEIDAATGEIKTKEKLDRETVEAFKVTVTAFEKREIIRLISQLTKCVPCVVMKATLVLNSFQLATQFITFKTQPLFD